MTTRKQAEANKANAKHSTGPKSIEGKQAVSGNRITHGILSTRLLLADESAEEYQALLDGLQAQLNPVGTLELSLVERIAVSLWRQRRLVKAETASIMLNMTPNTIAEKVGEGLDISKFSGNKLTGMDLNPPDQETMDWCREALAECKGDVSPNQLQKKAPHVFEQLTEDAEAEGMTVSEYLEEEVDLDDYVRELATWWCKKELDKARRYEQISQLTGTAMDHLRIPWPSLETFAKYQAALDSQTYKAMKALREAQEWRLKTIESELETDSEAA